MSMPSASDNDSIFSKPSEERADAEMLLSSAIAGAAIAPTARTTFKRLFIVVATEKNEGKGKAKFEQNANTSNSGTL